MGPPTQRSTVLLSSHSQQLGMLPHLHPIAAAVEKGELQYHSTVLLKRSQAAMQYNKDSQQYETPQMAIYFHADRLFSSNPAAGVATWLDLLVTAKYPW